MKVYGYVLDRLAQDRILTPRVQRETIQDAFEDYKRERAGWETAVWGGVFEDRDSENKQLLRVRKNGRKLLGVSVTGDAILVASHDTAFHGVNDLVDTALVCCQRGIHLHILDAPSLRKPFAFVGSPEQMQMLSLLYKVTGIKIKRRVAFRVTHAKKPVQKNALGWDRRPYLVNGQQVWFYFRDKFACDVGKAMLAKQRTLKLKLPDFHRWCLDNNWRDLAGNQWSQARFRAFMTAARKGFPLPDGSYKPAQPPQNAISLIKPEELLNDS